MSETKNSPQPRRTIVEILGVDHHYFDDNIDMLAAYGAMTIEELSETQTALYEANDTKGYLAIAELMQQIAIQHE